MQDLGCGPRRLDVHIGGSVAVGALLRIDMSREPGIRGSLVAVVIDGGCADAETVDEERCVVVWGCAVGDLHAWGDAVSRRLDLWGF